MKLGHFKSFSFSLFILLHILSYKSCSLGNCLEWRSKALDLLQRLSLALASWLLVPSLLISRRITSGLRYLLLIIWRYCVVHCWKARCCWNYWLRSALPWRYCVHWAPWSRIHHQGRVDSIGLSSSSETLSLLWSPWRLLRTPSALPLERFWRWTL